MTYYINVYEGLWGNGSQVKGQACRSRQQADGILANERLCGMLTPLYRINVRVK